LARHPVFDGVTHPFRREFDGAPVQFFPIDARGRPES
jgi:hypothetical protein